MQTMEEKIRQTHQTAQQGNPIPREDILALLAIDPDSREAMLLREAAHQLSLEITGGKARIWASIGVDFQPCEMNCRFCAFGKDWCQDQSAYTWSQEEILAFARHFVAGGARWITLRTTEDYGFDRLCQLAQCIKAAVPGSYGLVANTGNCSAAKAKELFNSGFEIIYHSIRLGEGVDTPFAVTQRRSSLTRIQQSPLDLAFLVEPIGPEHGNEAIADILEIALEHEAALSGAMARIPVPGTPLGELGQLSDTRLAQIIAIVRLAAGFRAPNICVHPASKLAVHAGANVVVVDIGATPRDKENLFREWHGFDLPTARAWLTEAGYQIDTGDKIDLPAASLPVAEGCSQA